ncbi:hypothetical protein TcWFU_009595 [Taenia crassiceps]|uniref:Uncharacterized protein n=1 Tax=Taenia crassiceps TaxID=6207 RepID=A0ABR4QN08_9CEST
MKYASTNISSTNTTLYVGVYNNLLETPLGLSIVYNLILMATHWTLVGACAEMHQASSGMLREAKPLFLSST